MSIISRRLQDPLRPVMVSSMEDSAISEGFRNLQPSQNYDAPVPVRPRPLPRRLVSRHKCHPPLYLPLSYPSSYRPGTDSRIGNADRTAEQIEHFQKTPYWNVHLTAEGLTVHREKIQSENEAEELSAKCQNQNLQIISVEKKQKSHAPPGSMTLLLSSGR